MVLTRVENPLSSIIITEKMAALKLSGKAWGKFSDTVNIRIYILESQAISLIPCRQFDLVNLFPALPKERKPLFGHTSSGYWCDIRRPEGYSRCHSDMLNGLVAFLLRVKSGCFSLVGMGRPWPKGWLHNCVVGLVQDWQWGFA